MSEQEPRMRGFELLLAFIGGDNRIPDAIHWQFSIKAKIFAMEFSYDEALAQIPKCFDELREIEKRGYGNNKECIKLALRYESFLNSIYSLCENLSNIVKFLYPSFILPQHFTKQKSRFLKTDSIDPDYSKILAKTSWFDEVHAMRAESTHYLSGLITIPSSTALGYVNLPKSQRKGSLGKIKISDVEKHIKQIHNDVRTFLTLFGNHFVPILNQDSHLSLVCISSSDKVIGIRSISLKEYLNQEQWTCQGSKECPERVVCQTRKN